MSSIQPVSGNTVPQPVAQKPEALEARRSGPDHDGDSDDRAGAAAVKPTVNTSGQLLGQLVNAKA